MNETKIQKYKLHIAAGLAVIFVATALAVVSINQQQRTARAQDSATRDDGPRIVSLVPSLTEALCMLGLEENLVGVSKYCNYPPSVTNIAVVGGFADANVEAIVRLKATHVVTARADDQKLFAPFGIKTILLRTQALDDVYDNIMFLGEEFDRSEIAVAWLERINALAANIIANRPKTPPRVLVCTARDPGAISQVYISGHEEFYTDIVELAGGVNAYTGKLSMPMIKPEGLLKVNPDIIIDIMPVNPDITTADLMDQWAALHTLNAVQNGEIHFVTEDWAVRPGPRIGFLMQRIAEIVQE